MKDMSKTHQKSFLLIINTLAESSKNSLKNPCFSQKNAVPSCYESESTKKGKNG